MPQDNLEGIGAWDCPEQKPRVPPGSGSSSISLENPMAQTQSSATRAVDFTQGQRLTADKSPQEPISQTRASSPTLPGGSFLPTLSCSPSPSALSPLEMFLGEEDSGIKRHANPYFGLRFAKQADANNTNNWPAGQTPNRPSPDPSWDMVPSNLDTAQDPQPPDPTSTHPTHNTISSGYYIVPEDAINQATDADLPVLSSQAVAHEMMHHRTQTSYFEGSCDDPANACVARRANVQLRARKSVRQRKLKRSSSSK